MDFTVKTGDPEKQRSACVVVGIYSPKRLSPAAQRLDKASRGQLSQLLKSNDIDTSCGATTLIHSPAGRILAKRVLVVGCGHPKKFDAKAFRKISANTATALNKSAVTEAISYLTELDADNQSLNWKARQHVIASDATGYRFDEFKSDAKPPKRPLRKLILGASTDESTELKEGVRQGKAIASGVERARRLGNLPGNVCTPTYLAEQAIEIKKQYGKLKIDILEERDMEKLGMGSLLSVSQGSRQPAKLIVMHYKGSSQKNKPVVLVGKGVTFDSGGISLKPGAAMDEMKFDMCGAASVLGTVAACAELGLPINLIGIIPTTENLPDGEASKPGDIVTSMSGQTIEVLNTDAEGRLILCDALTYVERFKPEVVIDIATLTGACIMALGHHATGVMTNHQPLADDILDAGLTSGDRGWQLPMWDEYDEQISSNFADMANIGGKGAGTITAACFLARFTKNYQWAHMDIAGVAWKSGAAKGSTGRPVPLLTQFLLDRSGINTEE